MIRGYGMCPSRCDRGAAISSDTIITMMRVAIYSIHGGKKSILKLTNRVIEYIILLLTRRNFDKNIVTFISYITGL